MRNELEILAVFEMIAQLKKLAEHFLEQTKVSNADPGYRPAALLLSCACTMAAASLENAIKVLEDEDGIKE